jgi:hypothetical protein
MKDKEIADAAAPPRPKESGSIMSVSSLILEIRIETPPGDSWPGLADLVRVWDAELQKTGFGRLNQMMRRTQLHCTMEADVISFELLGDFDKLRELCRERLRQFQVPVSTVVSFLELTRDGEPTGLASRYAVCPVYDDPLLVPWGWQEQAMMAVILAELHQNPQWRDLARRLEEPLSRFTLMGMGAMDPAALPDEEREAFLAAAERAYQDKANAGPIGWSKPDLYPDWLHRYRLHLERWKAASSAGRDGS